MVALSHGRIKVDLHRHFAAGAGVEDLQSHDRTAFLNRGVELTGISCGRAISLENHIAPLDARLGGRTSLVNFRDADGRRAKTDSHFFGFHPQDSRRYRSRRSSRLGLMMGCLLGDQAAHVDLDTDLLATADIKHGQGRCRAALDDGRRKLVQIGDETAVDADDGIARLDARLGGRAFGSDIDDLQNQPSADLNLLGSDPQALQDRPGRRCPCRGWCRGCLGGSCGGRLGEIGRGVAGGRAGLVKPVRVCSFPAALRSGVQVGTDLASLCRYRTVAGGTRTPLAFCGLEDVNVNRITGRRRLNTLGIRRRPAVFRPRDLDLDHIIDDGRPGAAKDLTDGPVGDDGCPCLGLKGMLRIGDRAR